MKRLLIQAVTVAMVALGAGVRPARAVVAPRETALSEKSFRQPDLCVP